MKLLASLGFLLVFGLSWWVSQKRTNSYLLNIEKGESVAKNFLFSFLSILLAFVGFWILTGIFSAPLILILGGILLVSFLFQYLIRAIVGLTLPEKIKKINVLMQMRSFEPGFKQGLEGQNLYATWIILAIVLLNVLISLTGSLWVYWQYPLGDPKARVLIALFQFTLPTLIGMALQLMLIWPAITSEFVDDDLRNFHLSTGFSNILYLTTYLLFPLWIFRNDIALFSITLPPFWLLLSIPLMLFLLVYVFPFFVGMYQHRHQTRSMMEWQQEWLSEVSRLLQLPESETRSRELEKKFDELEREREKHLKDSGLFQFFLYIYTGRTTHPKPVLSARANVPDPHSRALMNLLEIARELGAQNDIEAETLLALEQHPGVAAERRLQEAKKSMPHPIYAPLVDAIWEHRSDLVAWDIRFNQAFKLNELYERVRATDSAGIKEFVKASLEEIERRIATLSGRKNALAGSLVSALSVVLVWLFNIFEDQIINTISVLLNLS